MSASRCPRLWEVEAARDGRLDDLAGAELARHVAQCRDCEHERAQLAQLQRALRDTMPADDALQLRRVRQRMLADAANGRLRVGPARGPRARIAGTLALAVALSCGLWAIRPEVETPARPTLAEPVALQLTAPDGARYERERKGDVEYVRLSAGSLHLAFDRSQHARLLVQTPDGEIEDIGTVFDVEVEDGSTTYIGVSEGAVRFRRAGQADVTLSAGEVFERTPPTAAAAQSEPEPVARPAQRKPTEPKRMKTAPVAESSGSAEDRAYLGVLELLHAGRQEDARAAARRYCHDYPNGLRVRELERVAHPSQP